MAVVLGVAAVVLLLVAAALGPDGPSFWSRLLYLVAAWSGPLLLLAAIVWVARGRIDRLLRDRLIDTASPSLIRSMPPRSVLGSLLPWIYGEEKGHQDVLTGVLGGAGRDLAGGDTAVSRNTTAQFRIWSLDDHTVQSEATWTHEFSGVRSSDKLVVFATYDDKIAALVAQERRYPLFELWRVPDDDALDEFGRSLRDTFEIGIAYRDGLGVVHQVKPRSLPGFRVPLRQFDQYVRLPDEINRQDLYIVEYDLWDLTNPDHILRTIETLTLKARGAAGVDIGFYQWTAPHPCYVETVTFDVSELEPAGASHEFRAIKFTMRNTASSPMEIRPTGGLIELPVNSWMLPGHGVTLLWRPAG